MSETFAGEWRRLLKLALPIMAGGAVNSIMPFMNTVYLGHLGEASLASGGLSLSIFVFLMVLFWGLFSTLAALIARYQGAGEEDKIGPLVKSALLLALVFSIPIIIVFHLVPHILNYMGYSLNLVTGVRHFFDTMSFATPADLMLTTLYALCFGLSKPRYVLLVTLVQVPLNLFLNYAFIFGAFGFPMFGVAGIGVGVACTYWLMLIVLFAILFYLMPFRQYLRTKCSFRGRAILELVRIGGPAGTQWLLEMGFFSFIALMMGKISIVALAAYQVVFQIYSLFFNIIYNFNQAVTIRVADGLGQKSPKQVKYSYLGSYVFIAFILIVILLILLFGEEPLIHLFTEKNAVTSPLFLELCWEFLWLMPVFAVFDLLGYTHFEILRAFKDTRFPMLVVLVVYWVVAAPIIYVLIHLGYIHRPLYLWAFMIVASAFSLLGQGLRYRYQYKKLLIKK